MIFVLYILYMTVVTVTWFPSRRVMTCLISVLDRIYQLLLKVIIYILYKNSLPMENDDDMQNYKLRVTKYGIIIIIINVHDTCPLTLCNYVIEHRQ
jgi:uncharacterized protein YebE (UPF0316 family)